MLVQRVGFVLLLLMIAAVPASDQTPRVAPGETNQTQSAIRVSVNLVQVPVSVTNAQGQFVTGLAQGNFRIYEDGRQQQIALFEAEDIPVMVGLVVDHSGSMQTILPEVSAAAVAFARSSNPKDQMFVVDFNDMVSLELPAAVPFTSDVQELERAVSGVKAEGRTALNDAIMVALGHLGSARGERQALIIVSDGGDNASRHKFDEVLREARRSNASIYSIGIFGANQADQNPGVLEKLAKVTGGKAYFPHSAGEVTSICMQIARDIRQQYMLGYSTSVPALGNSYRKIEVKVDAPNHERVRVRTRTGYVPQPGLVPVSPASSLGDS